MATQQSCEAQAAYIDGLLRQLKAIPGLKTLVKDNNALQLTLQLGMLQNLHRAIGHAVSSFEAMLTPEAEFSGLKLKEKE